MEEVTHDCNVGLTKKIIAKGYINSYDTWHGMFLTPCIYLLCLLIMYIYFSILYEDTKGMANAMKSNAVGRVKDKGKTWFPELSDKSE